MPPIGIAGHNLTVEHGCLGRHLAKQRRDRSKALGEVMPIAAEQDDARAHLVGMHAVAVELQLVHPTITAGHSFAGDGPTGRNETELRHKYRM